MLWPPSTHVSLTSSLLVLSFPLSTPKYWPLSHSCQSLCTNYSLCLDRSCPRCLMCCLTSLRSLFNCLLYRKAFPNRPIENGTPHSLLFIHSIYYHLAIINLFVNLFIVRWHSLLKALHEDREGTLFLAITIESPAQWSRYEINWMSKWN